MSNNIKDLIIELSQKILTDNEIQRIIRRYPKLDNKLYKKAELRQEFIILCQNGDLTLTKTAQKNFDTNILMKITRTISGVTPVTVLTKPFPCPGKCIFCPNDVRMPKSYLSDEPGAQRAFRNKFDPFSQTYNRLIAYKAMGHPTDKVELIILGGTWTSYPIEYQIWFVKRCFDAMNAFHSKNNDFNSIDIENNQPYDENYLGAVDISGENITESYNQIVSKALIPLKDKAKKECATWEELEKVQIENIDAESRCIGLVIETRPDEINEKEIINIRRLGATKTQIGFQSLNDEVLTKNKRGHDVNTTANAVNLLRMAGFKIHAHWMPNLYGSNPEMDVKDFQKMFSDGNFKPDELKVYPCSLIHSAELMQYYKKGIWKPYVLSELKYVLKEIYKLTPRYTRITRMIRDIGSQDIVTGNKTTNLREIVEKELKEEKVKINEIRYREIRSNKVKSTDFFININKYDTKVSSEFFIEYINKDDQIAGFLRLSLPNKSNNHFIEELIDSAIIREVHVYGKSIEIGESDDSNAQHSGFGKSLIKKAEEIAKESNFKKIAVISAIGTRNYYSKLGYHLVDLYQAKSI